CDRHGPRRKRAAAACMRLAPVPAACMVCSFVAYHAALNLHPAYTLRSKLHTLRFADPHALPAPSRRCRHKPSDVGSPT
ncbi:MAG TPA: hypothetical protein PLP53_06690, partial [Plasticicumulans sp.]|nr:hypothetical protein [Plasticicumulans sp.]